MMDLFNRNYFKESVHNIIAIADGGPDWSVKGVLNFMSLGFFWLNSQLDILVIQCYAPGHSRFNPIERYWSYLTKWLVGVVLPVDLNGVIPSESDSESWNIILNNAATMCALFWNVKKVDGHKVTAERFTSDSSLIEAMKKTHQLIHNFTNASAKKIRESPDLTKLQWYYQLFVNHCTRKPYQVEFIRCTKSSCGHCTKLPTRENSLLQLVREFGGSFPTPSESKFYKGHFTTLIERYNILSFQQNVSDLCEYGTCQHGCKYTFFSDADKKRH